MNSEKQKSLTTTADGLRAWRRYLFLACLGIWVARWTLMIVEFVRVENYYFSLASTFSLEPLRALYASYDHASSSDFYKILKICDRILPSGAELQLVLPTEPQKKNEFLSGKARYFLYPRNYGDNATRKDHILVYQVKDFHPPAGYETFMVFAPDKYLLINRTPQRGYAE